jgi:hypothetical protein
MIYKNTVDDATVRRPRRMPIKVFHCALPANGEAVADEDGVGESPCAVARCAGGYLGKGGWRGGAEPAAEQAQKCFPACGKGKARGVWGKCFHSESFF